MKSTLMKLIIIGLSVSLFPIQAIAEGLTGAREIDFLYQRDCRRPYQGFEIRLTEPHANPDGCTNNYVLQVQCGSQAYRSAVGMSLTAFSGDYLIEAWVNGCDAEGHAIVRALKILKD